MFTGIIEEIGTIKNIRRGGKSVVLEVRADKVLRDLQVGDSIATNGVCLTVISFSAEAFCADVMPETMSRTNLGCLRSGSRVNLERALTLSSRLGGHIVTGHVDGTGEIRSKERDDNAVWVTMKEATCAERGIKQKTCTVCGTVIETEELEKLPHTYGEWEIITEPTCTESGVESAVCEVCGETPASPCGRGCPCAPVGRIDARLPAG